MMPATQTAAPVRARGAERFGVRLPLPAGLGAVPLPARGGLAGLTAALLQPVGAVSQRSRELQEQTMPIPIAPPQWCAI